MTFLSPWSALGAALVAIPLLLLLYFLKLRRRLLRVPSTMLWQGAFRDLEVNAPFQRLRVSSLLLLQLLILILLLLALADPLTRTAAAPADRTVLLIDRSASMSAADADGGPRLEAARERARRMVQRLTDAGSAQVMIVTFADTARVDCGFESDPRPLLAALDAVEAGDGEAQLDQALRLADAFSRTTDEESAGSSEVILLSDGGVAEPTDATGFTVEASSFRYTRIGPDSAAAVDNVGVVTFSARRVYEDPARVLLFARLLNAGPRPVEMVLTLRADDEVAGLRTVTVPAAAQRPGEVSITFEIEMPGGAIIELGHNHADALPADDRAWLVLPPPSRPRIALVHAGERPDPFLAEILQALEPQRLEPMSLERFTGIDPRLLDSGARYDLIVFDRVSPARLPGVPSLTFGGVPAGVGTTAEPTDEGRRLLSWLRQHPVLRHVSLDTIVFSGFSGYELPAGATPLAWGPQGPVIAEVATRGARHVLVGFEPARSNWPVHVSFTVFLMNAMDHLTLAGSGAAALVRRPGEPISVRAGPSVESITLEGPVSAELPVSPGAVRSLPPLSRVGVYRVRGAVPPMDRIAVSLLSDAESDIRPRDSVLVNATRVLAGGPEDVVPRPLWPWLVAAAGVLLLAEWLMYGWRMSR